MGIPLLSLRHPSHVLDDLLAYCIPHISHPSILSTHKFIAMPPKKAAGAAATKDKKAAAAPAHASYKDMIKEAILNLKERNGSSRQAIKKYVKANNNITVTSETQFDSLFNKALKSGVEKGDFQQPKGPSGPVKLAKKEAKPAEKKAAAPKEKAVKDEKEAKPKATKTKTAKPKTATTKAKKATTAKKASTAKPKANTAVLFVWESDQDGEYQALVSWLWNGYGTKERSRRKHKCECAKIPSGRIISALLTCLRLVQEGEDVTTFHFEIRYTDNRSALYRLSPTVYFSESGIRKQQDNNIGSKLIR